MDIIIKLMHLIIGLFPPRLLVGLIYRILIFKGYRKQVINNNYNSTIAPQLSNTSFPEFYKKCIYNISKIMVETITFNKSQVSKIRYNDISEIEARCKANNGLILMASHYGNWELACINLPLHTTLPCYGVYKPLKNKALDKKIIHLRSRFGLRLVPMNSIARSIANNYNKKIPAIYILIADQNPRSIQNVVWVKFLGIMSAYSSGLIKFQKKYKFPVAYMKTIPGKNMYEYAISFEFYESTNSNSPIEWYSQNVENQIKNAPHNWLWSHKRWKRKFDSSLKS